MRTVRFRECKVSRGFWKTYRFHTQEHWTANWNLQNLIISPSALTLQFFQVPAASFRTCVGFAFEKRYNPAKLRWQWKITIINGGYGIHLQMIFFCPLSCFFSGVYTQGFVVVLTPNINDLNNQWPPFLLTTAHRLKTTQQHSATCIKKNSPIAPNLEVQLKQLKVFSGFAMNDDLHVPLNQLHPKETNRVPTSPNK